MAIGEGGVHLVHGHGVHARHLVLLLPLHPPVLEPDLDLPLRQSQLAGELRPSLPSEEMIEVELFLQLQDLLLRVNCPHPHEVSSRPTTADPASVCRDPGR